MNVVSQYRSSRPVLWTGRYKRIPGDESVFHLEWINGELWPVIKWSIDDEEGTCRAIQCDVAGQLAESVARAKRQSGGDGGGAFSINEFGQVLVPASVGRACYLAGEIEGRLLFENPFCPEEPIDLADDHRLQPGDPWKLPYIGIPHNLSRYGRVYFYRRDEHGGASEFPPRQDPQLLRALRMIRPRGAVRFVVNPSGIVLTKCPPIEGDCPEEDWQPVFVGSISVSHWFEKE